MILHTENINNKIKNCKKERRKYYYHSISQTYSYAAKKCKIKEIYSIGGPSA